jgi:predicted DNA-binding antitoxin AbrB/MazE fold protein
MLITIEATYEDGVLKPVSPLPLREHSKVRITIGEDAQGRASRVRASYGLMGWKGDSKTIERLALDPEFDIQESP